MAIAEQTIVLATAVIGCERVLAVVDGCDRDSLSPQSHHVLEQVPRDCSVGPVLLERPTLIATGFPRTDRAAHPEIRGKEHCAGVRTRCRTAAGRPPRRHNRRLPGVNPHRRVPEALRGRELASAARDGWPSDCLNASVRRLTEPRRAYELTFRTSRGPFGPPLVRVSASLTGVVPPGLFDAG